MQFNGFTQNDFDTFKIDGLDERMEAIRTRIRPKFEHVGQSITQEMEILTGNEMHLHIAKHARRTVNPPKDTWMAICHDKRGYKKHPHFQVGLFDDHLFIWLAFIYELPNKSEIASKFLNHFDEVNHTIQPDYVISQDHMKKDAQPMDSLGEKGLKETLKRFESVKKAEFLVGQHIAASDPLLNDGEALMKVIQSTFKTLLPLYKLSLK